MFTSHEDLMGQDLMKISLKSGLLLLISVLKGIDITIPKYI
jgi:hypothetical protein